MEKSRMVNLDDRDSEKKGCHEGMLHELEDIFKGLLENGKCRKRSRAMMVLGCEHGEDSGSEFDRSRKSFVEGGLEDGADDDGDEELGMSCDDSEEEGLDLSSEEQETLPGMLKWLTSVARSPHNTSIGVRPRERWMQVVRAKNALLVQRDNAEVRYQNSPLPGHQVIHPSMYDDNRKSTARSRYSIRRPRLTKLYCSSSCCNGSPVSLAKSRASNCRELVSAWVEPTTDLVVGTSGGATGLQVYSNAITAPNRRKTRKTGHFQARVDEWKGSGLDSDTKWLGTRVWPLADEEALDDTLGSGLIGKGRPDCCSCEVFLSGSVECTRFHIAEKRMELKRDIGDAFFHWRFNQMGEEVALGWTEKEEKTFKKMMVADPQSFWENAMMSFRGKKREQLVSYYFNVFLINRRRYQNRATPRLIDSDDEGPFGAVGNGFGRDAVASFNSDIMICSENNECKDLD